MKESEIVVRLFLIMLMSTIIMLFNSLIIHRITIKHLRKYEFTTNYAITLILIIDVLTVVILSYIMAL